MSEDNLDLRFFAIEPTNGKGAGFPGELPRLDLTTDETIPLGLAIGSPPTRQTAKTTAVAGSGPSSASSQEGFWLQGHVVLCPCPECQAPMTVRLWLLVADCWRCGTSIELTAEQERAVDQLLRQRRAAPASPAGPRRPKSPEARPTPTNETVEQDRTTSRPPVRRPAHAPLPPPAQLQLESRVTDWLRELPAWLASLILHLVLLTLLAMFALEREPEYPRITLSMAVSRADREGDKAAVLMDEARFDLPLPEDRLPRNDRQMEAMLRADQDARPLRIDPNSSNPHLPDLDRLKSAIRRGSVEQRSLAARDPRLRTEMIRREGGTTLTEAAVARGLYWLSRKQHVDGSWSLRGRSEINAGTSLALLPFLGAGQTHLVGHYKDTVSGGLRYLLETQKRDGDLRGDASSQYGMYVHGQATIVLCEAYAMTGDELLHDPAQRAIQFIANAQYPRGGWRYRPRRELNADQVRGDTSVFGWQVMALQSARAAGLEVPSHTLELADQYLDTVTKDDGATYAYQQGQSPSPSMTAEALLCRMYLGWHRNQPALEEGIAYLIEEHPPQDYRPDIYYWYYATQAIHHVGGRQWEKWNQAIRNALVDLQETRGANAGSWPIVGPHGGAGGRVYVTSLAVCTLEVYYRHAPIFRRIDLR